MCVLNALFCVYLRFLFLSRKKNLNWCFREKRPINPEQLQHGATAATDTHTLMLLADWTTHSCCVCVCTEDTSKRNSQKRKNRKGGIVSKWQSRRRRCCVCLSKALFRRGLWNRAATNNHFHCWLTYLFILPFIDQLFGSVNLLKQLWMRSFRKNKQKPCV